MSDIVNQLKSLKLQGMASAYAELLNQGANASVQLEEGLIKHLIDAETTERVIRSIGYQMAAARFPIHRSLADFDFSQSKVDESLIRQLATFDFTEAAQNVVLVSGTGTGKTHLATSLGVSAIQQHGMKVRFAEDAAYLFQRAKVGKPVCVEQALALGRNGHRKILPFSGNGANRILPDDIWLAEARMLNFTHSITRRPRKNRYSSIKRPPMEEHSF